MRKLRRIVQNMDIFQQPVNLKFNKKDMYRTNLGLIISIVFFSFIILCGMYFGQDLVERKVPSVVMKTEFNLFPQPYILSQKDMLAISIQKFDNWEPWYDPRIFTITIIQRQSTIKIEQNGDVTFPQEFHSYPMEPCTPQNFNQLQTQEGIQLVPMSNLLCATHYLKIGGNIDYGDYFFLNIALQRCQENCKSNEEIDQALKKNWFVVYLFDSQIDENNLTNPLFSYVKSYYSVFSQKFPTTGFMSFQRQQVYIDVGTIFEDIKTYQTLGVLPTTTTIAESKEIFLLAMDLSLNTSSATFRYKKIQAVLGEIGGVVQLILSILIIVYSPYIKNDIQQKLLKSHIQFLDYKTFSEKKISDFGLQKRLFDLADNINEENDQESNDATDREVKKEDEIQKFKLLPKLEKQQVLPSELIKGHLDENFNKQDQNQEKNKTISSSFKASLKQTDQQLINSPKESKKITQGDQQQLYQNKAKNQSDHQFIRQEYGKHQLKKPISEFLDSYISERFDVLDIITRLDSVEQLQYLLLDQSQLFLLNYTRNKIISSQQGSLQVYLHNEYEESSEGKKDQKQRQKIMIKLKELKNQFDQNQSSEIDRRLQKILDFDQIGQLMYQT